MSGVFITILGILMAGGLYALFNMESETGGARGKKLTPTQPGLRKKGFFRELPEDAIVVRGQWYRRVYGFDSKCCGHPQYGHYYIQLNEVEGGWRDGQHSAQMFPLEAFDDRKNGAHDCEQHMQSSGRHHYCYVCGKSVETRWEREMRETAEKAEAAKRAEWDALPDHRKAARIEYDHFRKMARPKTGNIPRGDIEFEVIPMGGSYSVSRSGGVSL